MPKAPAQTKTIRCWTQPCCHPDNVMEQQSMQAVTVRSLPASCVQCAHGRMGRAPTSPRMSPKSAQHGESFHQTSDTVPAARAVCIPAPEQQAGPHKGTVQRSTPGQRCRCSGWRCVGTSCAGTRGRQTHPWNLHTMARCVLEAAAVELSAALKPAAASGLSALSS